MMAQNDAIDRKRKQRLKRLSPHLQAVDPTELLHWLPCLTDQAKEQVRCNVRNNGKMDATNVLFEQIWKRERWFGQLVNALHKAGHTKLSEDLLGPEKPPSLSPLPPSYSASTDKPPSFPAVSSSSPGPPVIKPPPEPEAAVMLTGKKTSEPDSGSNLGNDDRSVHCETGDAAAHVSLNEDSAETKKNATLPVPSAVRENPPLVRHPVLDSTESPSVPDSSSGSVCPRTAEAGSPEASDLRAAEGRERRPGTAPPGFSGSDGGASTAPLTGGRRVEDQRCERMESGDGKRKDEGESGRRFVHRGTDDVATGTSPRLTVAQNLDYRSMTKAEREAPQNYLNTLGPNVGKVQFNIGPHHSDTRREMHDARQNISHVREVPKSLHSEIDTPYSNESSSALLDWKTSNFEISRDPPEGVNQKEGRGGNDNEQMNVSGSSDSSEESKRLDAGGGAPADSPTENNSKDQAFPSDIGCLNENNQDPEIVNAINNLESHDLQFSGSTGGQFNENLGEVEEPKGARQGIVHTTLGHMRRALPAFLDALVEWQLV